MRDFLREYFWAVVLSVLLHGLLVGGVVLAALISFHRTTPSLQPLPIDAVVVDSQVLHAAQRAVDERAQQAARAKEAAEAKAAEEAKAKADAAAAEQAKAADEVKAAEEAKAAEQAKAEQHKRTDAANAA